MRTDIFLLSLALAGLATAPINAQTSQATAKTSTKIEVKDGRDVKVTGCLARHTGVSGFGLTDVMDRDTRLDNVILVGDIDKLEDHVGELVEIKGKLADARAGKVEFDSKTTIDREHAPDAESHVKSETKGEFEGSPVLGVRSVKTLRSSCS
jgi:hypothetical protein